MDVANFLTITQSQENYHDIIALIKTNVSNILKVRSNYFSLPCVRKETG